MTDVSSARRIATASAENMDHAHGEEPYQKPSENQGKLHLYDNIPINW
jgi:hypothetical protein